MQQKQKWFVSVSRFHIMQLNTLYSKTKVPSPSQYPRTCVSQPSLPMLRVYSHSETSNESPAFVVRIFSSILIKRKSTSNQNI